MTTTPKPSDAALLPCPFCGAEAELGTRRPYRNITSGRLGDATAIYCTKCHADMAICHEEFRDHTVDELVGILREAWNRRAIDAERPLDRSRRCPECGTHEVEIDLVCHNSGCDSYALSQSIHRGWESGSGAEQPQGEQPGLEPFGLDCWLIYYDDKDQRHEIFAGYGAAHSAARRYAQISGNWNAHLFVKVDSNSRDFREQQRREQPAQGVPAGWPPRAMNGADGVYLDGGFEFLSLPGQEASVWNRCLDECEQALLAASPAPAAVPEGMVLVPREPTESMLREFWHVCNGEGSVGPMALTKRQFARVRRAYWRLLAAASAPAQEGS